MQLAMKIPDKLHVGIVITKSVLKRLISYIFGDVEQF